MGTRALINIVGDSQTLVTIYKQFDGYPSGLGKDIYRILNFGETKIVNGIGQENPQEFNGMGCLAAYMVGQLKHRCGGIYIVEPTEEGYAFSSHGEDFMYTIYESDEGLKMDITSYDGTEGTFDISPLGLERFVEYMEREEE